MINNTLPSRFYFKLKPFFIIIIYKKKKKTTTNIKIEIESWIRKEYRTSFEQRE